MVFFSLITEFMCHLLVTFTYVFSSIIMITFLPDILVKTKYCNQSATDTPSPASVLMYNNSASPVSLVCNSSHNVTSSIDLSNNHGIPFLWTSSKNFYYPSGLILSWSQLTGSPSRQSLSLSIIPSHPWTQHIFLSFMYSPNTVFLSMSPLIEAQSLCQTSSVLQTLLSICSFTSLQAITPKVDGQTKCTNQTLKQYLCVYCNYQQDNWSKLLPLMEFAYNNALSATTSVSPFFTNKGYHPNITVYPECNIAFS